MHYSMLILIIFLQIVTFNRLLEGRLHKTSRLSLLNRGRLSIYLLINSLFQAAESKSKTLSIKLGESNQKLNTAKQQLSDQKIEIESLVMDSSKKLAELHSIGVKIKELEEKSDEEKQELQQEKSELEHKREELLKAEKKFNTQFSPFSKRIKRTKGKYWKNGKSGKNTTPEKPRIRTGKPIGAGGGGRKRPEDLDSYDRIEEVFPTYCEDPTCNTEIDKSKRPHDFYLRHVINLEKGKKSLECTMILYKIYRIGCPQCQRLASGNSQVPAPKGFIFGYGYLAYALMKRIQFRMIKDSIIDEFESLFGSEYSPCSETVSNWMIYVQKQLGPTMEQLLEELKTNPWIKIDETGMPIDGKKGWMWVFCTELVRIYIAANNRSHKIPLKVVKDYDGVIVSDFFSAYAKLDQEKGKCHVHLYRTISDLQDSYFKTIGKLTKQLVDSEEAKVIKRERKRKKRKSVTNQRGRPKKIDDNVLSTAKIKIIQANLEALTEANNQAVNLLDFLIKQEKENWSVERCREHFDNLYEKNSLLKGFKELNNIYKRIDTYWEDLFRYKTHPSGKDIKDNNLAESTVKNYATIRRTHGTWRSWDIAESIATILSVFTTAKLNNKELNYFHLWNQLIKGDMTNYFNFSSGDG